MFNNKEDVDLSRCHRCGRDLTQTSHCMVDSEGWSVCCECYGHKHLTPAERLAKVANEISEAIEQ